MDESPAGRGEVGITAPNQTPAARPTACGGAASWALAILALVLPLFITPRLTYDHLLLPKVALFLLAGSGVAAWVLLRSPGGRIVTPSRVPVWIFAVLIALSQGPSRPEVAAAALTGAFLFSAMARFFAARPEAVPDAIPAAVRERPLEFATLAGVVIAVYVLLQDRGIDFIAYQGVVPDWRGKLVATLGNPNHAGAYLGLILPYVHLRLALARTRSATVLWLAGALAITAGLLVVFTVGAWMGVIAAALVLPIYVRGFRVRVPRPRQALLIPLVFLAVFAFFIVPNPWNGRPGSLLEQAAGSARWRTGTGARGWIWANTLQMVRERPLTGVGEYIACYQEYAGRAYAARADEPHDRETVGRVDHAHFEILEVFAVSGAVTGAVLLWALAAFARGIPRAFRRASESERPLLLAALLAVTISLLHSFASFQWHIPSSAFLALLFAARLEGAAAVAASGPPRVSRRVVSAVAVLLVLGASITGVRLFEGSRSIRAALNMLESDRPDERRVEAAFRRGVALHPSADHLDIVSRWLIQRGRCDDAAPLLVELDQTERSLMARLWLSRCLEALGDRQAAAEWQRAVLELNPTWPGHLERLADLTGDAEERARSLRLSILYEARLHRSFLARADRAPNELERGQLRQSARASAAECARRLRRLAAETGEGAWREFAEALEGDPLDASRSAPIRDKLQFSKSNHK